ncbi:MAG: hypothetical protein IKT56_06235 [Clostridia bacterium]|nr:hypothetical protein [Clostridia bacterium]
MKNKKRSIASLIDANSAVKALLLIGAVVMAILFAVGGIYLLSMKNSKNNEKDISKNDMSDYFYELIEGNDSDEVDISEPLIIDMTLEEAFSFYATQTSYYQECSVKNSDGDGNTLVREKYILRDGDKYNIKTADGDVLLETIICDGENVLIIDEVTGKTSRFVKNDEVRIEELAALPIHSDIVALAEEYRTAENKNDATLSKCTYSLIRGKVSNMLSLNMTYRNSNVSEKYYYYLDYGLIYHCETIVSGVKPATSYSMTTTFFSADISDFVKEDSFKTNIEH